MHLKLSFKNHFCFYFFKKRVLLTFIKNDKLAFFFTSIFLNCIQIHFLKFIKKILKSVFFLKKFKHLPNALGYSVYFLNKWNKILFLNSWRGLSIFYSKKKKNYTDYVKVLDKRIHYQIGNKSFQLKISHNFIIC